jgi:hypothetical protein
MASPGTDKVPGALKNGDEDSHANYAVSTTRPGPTVRREVATPAAHLAPPHLMRFPVDRGKRNVGPPASTAGPLPS